MNSTLPIETVVIMNNVIVDQDKINDGKFEIKKDILLSEKRR
jgi:hypothetical protein